MLEICKCGSVIQSHNKKLMFLKFMNGSSFGLEVGSINKYFQYTDKLGFQSWFRAATFAKEIKMGIYGL